MEVRDGIQNQELWNNYQALSSVSDMARVNYEQLCDCIKKLGYIYSESSLLEKVVLDNENNAILCLKNNEMRKILTENKTSLEILMSALNIFMVQQTVETVCTMIDEEFCKQIWVAVRRNLGEDGSKFKDVFLNQIQSRLVGWKFTIQYAAENSGHEKVWEAYRHLMKSEEELDDSEGESGINRIRNYIIEQMVKYKILYPIDKVSEVARQNGMKPNELTMCCFCYKVFSKKAYKDKKLPCWIIGDYTWGNAPIKHDYENFCCADCEQKIASFNNVKKSNDMNALTYDSAETEKYLNDMM